MGLSRFRLLRARKTCSILVNHPNNFFARLLNPSIRSGQSYSGKTEDIEHKESPFTFSKLTTNKQIWTNNNLPHYTSINNRICPFVVYASHVSSSYSVEMRANKTPSSQRPLDLATWPFCFSEEARRLDRDSGEHKHLPPVLPDYSILSHLHSGLFWNQFFPGKVYWFMKDCVYALESIYFQFAYAEQGKRRL